MTKIESTTWIAALAALTALPINSQTSFAAISRAVTLQLVSGDSNQFDLSAHVDTLAPSLGTLSDSNDVVWVGNLAAILELDTRQGIPNAVINGLRIDDSDVTQSAVEFSYPIEIGVIEFDASDLLTQLFTSGVFQPVNEDEFLATAVNLMQTEGEAIIRVPAKPLTRQDLGEFAVHGGFDLGPEPQTVPTGRIELTLEDLDAETATYRVDLSLPLRGQSVEFEHLGLPVTVDYEGGTLVATGTLVLIIPEPGGLLLASIVSTWLLPSRGRRRLS